MNPAQFTDTARDEARARPLQSPFPPAYRRILAQVPANLWILQDAFWSVASYLAAHSILVTYSVVGGSLAQFPPTAKITSFAAIVVFTIHIFGIHDRRIRRLPRAFAVKLLIALSTAAMAFVLFSQFVWQEPIPNLLILLASQLTWIMIYLTRVGYWHLARSQSQRICVVGSPGFCENALTFLSSLSAPIEPIKVTVNPELVRSFETSDLAVQVTKSSARLVPRLATIGGSRFASWALDKEVDEVVIETTSSRSLLDPFIECLDQGLRVTSYTAFIEKHEEAVPVEGIKADWFLATAMEGLHPYYCLFKRISDLALGMLGLILSAPIVAVAALAIRLESPGPVFYSQSRVGRHNRPFQIYKLRTMATDAESTGAQWARKGDVRVTRVGRLLRKTRIDEVPQFWNIVKGEMAFIGPRPERPEFTGKLAREIPFYEKRHMIKPGLTGWAQINYPYGSSIEDARNKLRYDLYYVKYASLELDLHIIIRTIGAIMKGAR